MLLFIAMTQRLFDLDPAVLPAPFLDLRRRLDTLIRSNIVAWFEVLRTARAGGALPREAADTLTAEGLAEDGAPHPLVLDFIHRWLRPASERGDGFELHEVDSPYAERDARFLVSFMASYSEKNGVATPEEALRAAIDLTRDHGADDTVWCIYDRTRGERRFIRQGDFEDEATADTDPAIRAAEALASEAAAHESAEA
jgi:hypothetical protein